MSNQQNKSFQIETVIRPSKSWFEIDWRGLWEYRDMLRFLVIRDFIAKYKQTILGPAWWIIQPLFITVIFTIIFGNVAKIPTDGLPPFLFFLTGQLAWQYFQTCFNQTAGSLIGNASLFRKVYFPRVILPLSIISSSAIAFFIQLVTYCLFWIYFKFFTEAGATFQMQLAVLLFPILVLLKACVSLGAGLWMAALSAKYRDLSHMTTFISQGLLYLSPIIYPVSQIPEGLRLIAYLNPMTMIVESYRYVFLGEASLSGLGISISITVTALLLSSAILIYNHIQRNFVDYS